MNVITKEEAKDQNITLESLKHVIDWHLQMAKQAKGFEKERHFRLAALIRKEHGL